MALVKYRLYNQQGDWFETREHKKSNLLLRSFSKVETTAKSTYQQVAQEEIKHHHEELNRRIRTFSTTIYDISPIKREDPRISPRKCGSYFSFLKGEEYVVVLPMKDTLAGLSTYILKMSYCPRTFSGLFNVTLMCPGEPRSPQA